jgi:plasmid stabilization system protein ParE
MKELTLYPADLAAMGTAQLAALPITDFVAAERNVDEAVAYLKQLRAKLDAAKLQRYGEQARAALRDSGRDFGTAHIRDGALHIKYELPKKVTWSQTILKEMAERIVAAGDKVEDYIDVKLSVSESRYTHWPQALQQQFAAARTVEEGKPVITLTLDGGVA